MKNMLNVIEGIYNNNCLRQKCIPLFLGNPGLGKTKIIEQFAKKKGVNLVEFITSQRNPFEISGIPMPDKDIKKMSIWDFDTLLEMKDGDILFFDEILNGNPTVLNACLTLLENRRTISGKALANIMIVAAANPQGMSILTPQQKERFIWYDVKFDSSMFTEYLKNKYFLLDRICKTLCEVVLTEDFKGNNFWTPRSIDKSIEMTIYNVPNPYEIKLRNYLDLLVDNPFEEEIILPNDLKLSVGEKIKFLDLLKLKFNTYETIKQP